MYADPFYLKLQVLKISCTNSVTFRVAVDPLFLRAWTVVTFSKNSLKADDLGTKGDLSEKNCQEFQKVHVEVPLIY